MGKVTHYSYDSNGYLNQVTDNDDHLIESFLYDNSFGDNKMKVARVMDAFGNITTYMYDTEYRKV